MTDREFVYWLNGFLEISDAKKIDSTQTQIIKDHLALVLKKETPDRVQLNGFNLDKGQLLYAPGGSC